MAPTLTTIDRWIACEKTATGWLRSHSAATDTTGSMRRYITPEYRLKLV